MNNPKTFYIVSCAVFFSNATYDEYENLAITPFKNNNRYNKYLKFLSYFEVFTKDTLNSRKLYTLLDKTWISKKSFYFKDKHYYAIKRYLNPPFHYEDEGKDIIYTKEQKKLTPSEKGKKQKIKGVAGCGKTFVLAKRAVNAYIRTQKKVLILTYNISLINYIRDRISDVREDFPWRFFHLINYHQFFKSQANNYGLKINDLSDWDKSNFFDSVKDSIIKYDAIFIDEVQDYKTEWLDLINKYFLSSEGEFVVFGDEKQNIYDRPLDNEKEIIIKGIPGAWNKSLKTSIRFTENIAKIAARFQQNFLGKKYNLDQIAVIDQIELGFSSQIDYFALHPGAKATDFYEIIKKYMLRNDLHPSNVAILSSTVEKIREIDLLIRKNMKEKTTTMFEEQELFEKHNPTREDLETLRRNKKRHFYMKTGTMKLSTIHSFKGWEIDTLFLVLDDENLFSHDGAFTSHELVYTALTRAKRNLIVLNSVSEEYNQFFGGTDSLSSQGFKKLLFG